MKSYLIVFFLAASSFNLSSGHLFGQSAALEHLIDRRVEELSRPDAKPGYLKRETITLLQPFKLGAVLLLHAYKRIVSGKLDSPCNFFPSCSAFSVDAILTHPLIPGLFLTADRLARCHPHAAADYAAFRTPGNSSLTEDSASDY